MAKQGRFCQISTITAIVVVLFGALAAVSHAETLDDAWAVAVSQSHRLQAERHELQAGRDIVQAAKANRMPTVTNQTAYIGMSETPKIVNELPSIPGVPLPSHLETQVTDRNFVTNSTVAVLPLYTGGKIRSGINAANAQLSADTAGHAASTQDIKMSVTEAYFLVLRARRMLEVAMQAETALTAHERDATKMLETNLVTRNVVLAAQTAKSAATQDVLRAQNSVKIAEAAYNRLLNRPLDWPVAIEEIEVPPTMGNQPGLDHAALQNRSELRQLSAQSRVFGEQANIARADRLPQVVAGGTVTYMENSHVDPNTYFAGGVGVNWTPFDGGASRAKQRAAQQGAMAVNRMREETRSLIALQVQTATLDEQESRSRIAVAQQGVLQAEENLRIVTMQFQTGLTNHTEVLDAQTLATGARSNYYNAVYDAILASYRLRRALGEMN